LLNYTSEPEAMERSLRDMPAFAHIEFGERKT
jgi:hypothetical protein